MTYNEIIQKAGKRIAKGVYYVINNTRTDVIAENIESVKLISNSGLIGTAIKGCELTLKEAISGDIYITITASYQSYSATKTYGPYTLKEEPTYDANTKTYLHKIYDNIIKSMVEYQPITMTYPCTIYDFFAEVVDDIGYTTNIASLPNGSLIMENDIYNGINYTYRDVLDDIAQANGVLFEVDGNELKIRSLGTTETIINDDILKNINIEFKQKVGPINSIVLSRAGGSDNIYKQDETSIAENGLHEYKISDNQLMNGNNRSDFLPNLFVQLNGIEYYIYDCELVGYGDFEPLEKLQIQTGGNTYDSYMFNDEKVLTNGYTQTIFNKLPEETNTEYQYADETDKRINQAYIIVDKQNQEIKSLTSRTTTLENKENSDYQTLLNKFDNYASLTQLETLTTQVNTIQTDTYTKTEIQKIITGTDENGVKVTSVQTTSNKFDEDGLHIARTGAYTEGLFNEVGVNITDAQSNKSILFAGYVDNNNQDYSSYQGQTIVGTKNIVVERYAVFGKHSRIEDFTDNGVNKTGMFPLD